MKKGDIRSADSKAAAERGTSRQAARKARISVESGKAEAQAVLLKVRARRENLKLLREKGELIPLASVQRLWVEIITRAKTEFEALPVRMAPRLLGLTTELEIRSALRAEVERILRGLRDDTPIPD